MLSTYDPWVNLLRTTVAAFAAGVAGAEAITVVPFDSPLGRPDTFGRRIARNTSAVLLAEAHLGRVADPAGGAYAVERLTHDIAVAAWELFVELDERADPGRLDALVAATVAERDRQVATRRRPLTGLTEFPHLGEIAADARARPGRRRTSAATARRSRRCATTPSSTRSSWPRSVRSPRTRPAPPSPPTCWRPAASRSRRPGRPAASTSCWRRTPASGSSASPAPTRAYAGLGRRGSSGAARRPGPST